MVRQKKLYSYQENIKVNNKNLSIHLPSSSSLIAPYTSSVAHSSLSQGPTALPVSPAADLLSVEALSPIEVLKDHLKKYSWQPEYRDDDKRSHLAEGRSRLINSIRQLYKLGK
jgi:hypothetical protein